MTIVLLNSAKIKPRQHILAVPLVTSPGTIRSEFYQKTGIRHFMRIVSNGDNLYEMSNDGFLGKIRK